MGCTITLAYVLEEYEAQRPQQFNAIVAIAPMVQIVGTAWEPYSVMVALVKWLTAIGQGQAEAPTVKRSFEDGYAYRKCSDRAIKDNYSSFTRCKAWVDICE